MKLSELLHSAGMDSIYEDTEITDIVTDSKKATNGCMFVCLKGLKSDGHSHVREAISLGAGAVVVEKGLCADIPEFCPYINLIETDDTRTAQAKLYSAWYGNPGDKLKIIAVTGTNGKTSVTYMLKSIFESAMYKCGVIGTISCSSGDKIIFASPDDCLANMTTPDPKQLYRLLSYMAADGVQYVFIEASSHALKFSKLCALEFDTGIFTNLTQDHMDFHKTMDDYAKSKAKLFAQSKISILNLSSEFCGFMTKSAKGKVYTYSKSDCKADYYASEVINNKEQGIYYTLKSKDNIMKVKCRIPGSFTVDNTLCACTCALLHGISPKTIQTALSSMQSVEGRMEKVFTDINIDFSVFIDYAHTPDALENLLECVNSFKSCKERTVLIFGCGGDRDKSKRSKMGEIASKLADFTIVTSDNSRSESPIDIINDIEKGFGSAEHEVIVSRREAIEYGIKNARKGDIILLAGKGHEKYEIDAKGRHEFDEKKIVKDYISKYYK